MIGTLKAYDFALDRTHDATAYDRIMAEAHSYRMALSNFTPRSPLQVLQAINWARWEISQCDVPDNEALEILLACLTGLASCVRFRRHGTARAMRLIVGEGRRAGLTPEHDWFVVQALGAIARGAAPYRGR